SFWSCSIPQLCSPPNAVLVQKQANFVGSGPTKLTLNVFCSMAEISLRCGTPPCQRLESDSETSHETVPQSWRSRAFLGDSPRVAQQALPWGLERTAPSGKTDFTRSRSSGADSVVFGGFTL